MTRNLQLRPSVTECYIITWLYLVLGAIYLTLLSLCISFLVSLSSFLPRFSPLSTSSSRFSGKSCLAKFYIIWHSKRIVVNCETSANQRVNEVRQINPRKFKQSQKEDCGVEIASSEKRLRQSRVVNSFNFASWQYDSAQEKVFLGKRETRGEVRGTI